jgi:hypothetical protein
MKLKVSYDLFQSNWYVGELYHNFFNYLKEKGHDVEYIHINELAKNYNIFNSNNSCIFSIYNLIITNKKTEKTFIHSFYDGAPCMMDDNNGIKNFDISAFSCCSNLTQYEYDKYSLKYKILPSFYILENVSDLEYIEKFKNNINRNNNCYFNGLCYGHRNQFKKMLLDNNNFIIRDKSISSDYKTKQEYYEELNKYQFGLSLNGAASICYRDIEYFGMGIVNLREPLNILTNNPLIADIHYINFIDNTLNNFLYSDNIKEFNNIINDKLNDIIKNKQYQEVINNSKKWYNENCMLDSQLKMLYSFIEKSEII